MIERFKDKYGAGGIALFIILLTITIAIVGYVMANGSTPIGPSVQAPITVGGPVEGQEDTVPVVATMSAINAGVGLLGSHTGSGVFTIDAITPTPQPTATPGAAVATATPFPQPPNIAPDIFTWTPSFAITNPTAGFEARLFKSLFDGAVEDTHCITDAGTVEINIQVLTATGTSDYTAATLTCDSDGTLEAGSNDDPVDINEWIGVLVGTVTTATSVTVTIEYEYLN